VTTDRTEFRLVAGVLAAPQLLEKLQKLGMSSSLLEDAELRGVFEAFQWYCSNHKGEGEKIDLPLFVGYMTEERHATPSVVSLLSKLTDAGGEEMATLVELLDRLKTRAARRKLRSIGDSIASFTDSERQGAGSRTLRQRSPSNSGRSPGSPPKAGRNLFATTSSGMWRKCAPAISDVRPSSA